MTNYQINSKGETYITNPPRNQHGRIPTNYFENLILIYMIVKNERYKPSKFKEYVESLDILNDEDRELMPTRNYYIWKHHIDAAKQGLFQRQGILAKNPHGTFSISDKKFNDAYIKISGYIEIMKQPKPKPKRKNINPNPKHTPNTTTSNPQSQHQNPNT